MFYKQNTKYKHLDIIIFVVFYYYHIFKKIVHNNGHQSIFPIFILYYKKTKQETALSFNEPILLANMPKEINC